MQIAADSISQFEIYEDIKDDLAEETPRYIAIRCLGEQLEGCCNSLDQMNYTVDKILPVRGGREDEWRVLGLRCD